jgi:ABC-type sugar transport system ATPase subunit
VVFQNYALYPHMTVAENMGFALKIAKVPADERRAKVEEAAIWVRVCTRSLASRLDRGSSMRKTLGERTMARPMATYPHMTVAENMGFALKIAKVPADERRAKVEEAAERSRPGVG